MTLRSRHCVFAHGVAEGDDLASATAEIGGQDVGRPVAGDPTVGADPGGLQVRNVGFKPVGGYDTGPHAGDHSRRRAA